MGWAALGVAGLAAGVILVLIAWRWRAAITIIGPALDRLARGQRVESVASVRVGPVGRLAIACEEIQRRIDRLDADRQRWRAVLDAMAEAVIAVEARRLVFANASAGRLFGLGPDAISRLLTECIRSPQVQDAVEATLNGSGPFQGVITLPGREPLDPTAARTLEVWGALLPGPAPSGAVLVFHDVTELRRLERMRQDFVANISHELKTPLASIKAFAETLLSGALHDAAVNTRFLEQIVEQADRLDRLTLDLLSLARLESGQESYQHEPLALAPVVQAIVEAHRRRAEAKGLALSLELGALDGSVWVRADEEAIRQILDNLIDNALKYTPSGGRVAVSGQLDEQRGEVLLEVADTGLGIPREDLPRVFERFYRVDKARSRELGGTGLGLAIVKHLVQALGGQIKAASRLGIGSRFTVRLPVCASE